MAGRATERAGAGRAAARGAPGPARFRTGTAARRRRGLLLDPGPAAEHDPTLDREDALAQMLIGPAEDPGVDGDGSSPAPTPDAAATPPGIEPAPLPLPPAGQPSADAAQVRQLILESLAAGQPREAIELYLRDTMGFVEPSALVDAAIGTAG